MSGAAQSKMLFPTQFKFDPSLGNGIFTEIIENACQLQYALNAFSPFQVHTFLSEWNLLLDQVAKKYTYIKHQKILPVYLICQWDFYEDFFCNVLQKYLHQRYPKCQPNLHSYNRDTSSHRFFLGSYLKIWSRYFIRTKRI